MIPQDVPTTTKPGQLFPQGLTHQIVTVENQQTEISPLDVWKMTWAAWYVTSFQYGRSRWIEAGLAPWLHVSFLLPGQAPPAGAWNAILLDSTDQAGALGYHTDETGANIPYAEIFCATSIQDGVPPSEVLLHEILEMGVDPYVEGINEVRKALNPHTKEFYIVEVGDPVQNCAYDVGSPEGRRTGVIVADFAEPAWWQLDPDPKINENGPFSYRKSVNGPWAIAPGGYMSVAPENEPENWSQIFGEDRTKGEKAAKRDNFISRVHAPEQRGHL